MGLSSIRKISRIASANGNSANERNGRRLAAEEDSDAIRRSPIRDEPEATQPSVEARRSAGVRSSLLEYLHACAICHAEDLRHYCRVPSLFNRGEFIHYERCARCGTVLRNPRLPENYRIERYVDCLLPDDAKRLDRRRQIHYRHVLRAMNDLLPTRTSLRLLDFGCGAGGFLVEARAAGFDVMGLELNRDLADHVRRNHDIPVFQGLVTDPGFAEKRFNVILSSQVFEHLLDPRQTLRSLRQHLIAPGMLLIEVPNLSDIRERLHRGSTMDDSHLFYFNRSSLTHMLEEEGFEVREVHEGLRPYGMLGNAARFVPHRAMRAAVRLLSAAQIKTGLTVIAGLRRSNDGVS